jgi:hypothetical protein
MAGKGKASRKRTHRIDDDEDVPLTALATEVLLLLDC